MSRNRVPSGARTTSSGNHHLDKKSEQKPLTEFHNWVYYDYKKYLEWRNVSDSEALKHREEKSLVNLNKNEFDLFPFPEFSFLDVVQGHQMRNLEH